MGKPPHELCSELFSDAQRRDARLEQRRQRQQEQEATSERPQGSQD